VPISGINIHQFAISGMDDAIRFSRTQKIGVIWPLFHSLPLLRHLLPESSMRKANPRRAAVLPLGIKNRFQTELPALVALTAIGEPWFSDEHQSDLLAVALVVRELAPPESMLYDCAVELQRLCEQVIGIDKKVQIALNLAECLPWLQLQSNARIQSAIRSVMMRRCRAAA
jgi:hypothetical protein